MIVFDVIFDNLVNICVENFQVCNGGCFSWPFRIFLEDKFHFSYIKCWLTIVFKPIMSFMKIIGLQNCPWSKLLSRDLDLKPR